MDLWNSAAKFSLYKGFRRDCANRKRIRYVTVCWSEVIP